MSTVLLLVIDSGLSVDVDKVQALGKRAALAAFTGVAGPVLATLAILWVFWDESWKVSCVLPSAVWYWTKGANRPVLMHAFMSWLLNAWLQAALAAGAALAPTSLGFSAKLLAEVGQVESDMGQLICTAAVMDDVMSLVLLAEIKALQGGDVEIWEAIAPLLGSIGACCRRS